MKKTEEIRKLDLKTRNKLRAILASKDVNALRDIGRLKLNLGKQQALSIELVVSYASGIAQSVWMPPLFPKTPPFRDKLRPRPQRTLEDLLELMEGYLNAHFEKVVAQAKSLREIDSALIDRNSKKCSENFASHIAAYGWSHALLRKIVLLREMLEGESEEIEELLVEAGLSSNNIVVTSLVHTYAAEQNYLTIKRSVLNIPDKGVANRYSRTLAQVPFRPFAIDENSLAVILEEVLACSLIDSVILVKLNWNLCKSKSGERLRNVVNRLGDVELLARMLALFDSTDSEGEYLFCKRASAWLEHPPVEGFLFLIDKLYEGSDERSKSFSESEVARIDKWVGATDLKKLVSGGRFTVHEFNELARLEQSGTVTRSAVFNYWLRITDGQIGLERADLLKLMGLTRDLSKTIPIDPARNAIRISSDEVVRLIILLLLAKRSKNEMDGYKLRRLLERFAVTQFQGSLVNLVAWYEEKYPDIAEYIYEVATEDFIAKLKIAPHLSDIPEIRACLHEWMARFSNNEYYLERARAVRVDHQLNRVRNEIDDHRIYVDSSMFWSWINDELVIDLNSALTTSNPGKRSSAINCDEVLLASVIGQCYSAFCSNAIFGIASYIGRRIRHGTFYGHLYSSVISAIESMPKYAPLLKRQTVLTCWEAWKNRYSEGIQEVINERLHVYSRTKQNGLLRPDAYTPHKSDILQAAVKDVQAIYAETKTVESLQGIIVDYCWRLAEADLTAVQAFLKSQYVSIKKLALMDELVSTVSDVDSRLSREFKRELIHSIDKKLIALTGWFKRPSNVAPRASLALLYDAVVAEIKDSFPWFDPCKSVGGVEDLELVGGAYHVLYDSFYVILSNAAKYGDPTKPVRRNFYLRVNENERSGKVVYIEIASVIPPAMDPDEVRFAIAQRVSVKYDDANLYERKSGIPKLMQLAQTRKEFDVEFLGVVENEVVVRLSYALAF